MIPEIQNTVFCLMLLVRVALLEDVSINPLAPITKTDCSPCYIIEREVPSPMLPPQIYCPPCKIIGQTCSKGYYLQAGRCIECPCRVPRSVCGVDPFDEVICLCPEKYTGIRCEMCAPGYVQRYYYPYDCVRPTDRIQTDEMGERTSTSRLVPIVTTERDRDEDTAGATTTPSDSSAIIGMAVVGGVLVILIALLVLVVRWIRSRCRKVEHTLSPEERTTFVQVHESSNTNERAGGSSNGTLGYQRVVSLDEAGSVYRQSAFIDCLTYNSSKYEVPESEMVINMSKKLGSGQYGIVFEGTLRGHPVAFKTVRSNVPSEYFKALLSELKILTYIGHHENIVNLVGTNTRKIKSSQLYLGMELCKTSLLEHLRNWKKRMPAQSKAYAHQQAELELVREPLLRWASEIAAGNEYLAHKRIVHGDLAARNVLLTFDMRAKICDFGLARLMINYEYNMSAQQRLLPWKWMAPESLTHRHFSSESDVWAFGVTCWEIYSLGGVPYGGETWNSHFMDELDKGNRLSSPIYASQEIYSKMLECWRQNREQRPKFTELKQFFLNCSQRMASALLAEPVYENVAF